MAIRKTDQFVGKYPEKSFRNVLGADGFVRISLNGSVILEPSVSHGVPHDFGATLEV